MRFLFTFTERGQFAFGVLVATVFVDLRTDESANGLEFGFRDDVFDDDIANTVEAFFNLFVCQCPTPNLSPRYVSWPGSI